MPWLSATVTTGSQHVEALSDALLEAGALSVDVADAAAGTAQETPVFGEPGTPPPDGWGRNRVTALFAEDADAPAAMRAALTAVGLSAATACTVTRVDDQDWVRLTQSQFTPQRISGKLWIVPTWHVPPDPHAINIVLDPGLAFGTGTHPTTRLCLQWLTRELRPGDDVIDYGCGSGILAIAAARLGAVRVRGVDIDPQALIAARHNAGQNQVDAEFVAAIDRPLEAAAIVLANILANPLIVLAPALARLTRPGGRIVLSGILSEQAADVCNAYREWFDLEPAGAEDGWVLLSGMKR